MISWYRGLSGIYHIDYYYWTTLVDSSALSCGGGSAASITGDGTQGAPTTSTFQSYAFQFHYAPHNMAQ